MWKLHRGLATRNDDRNSVLMVGEVEPEPGVVVASDSEVVSSCGDEGDDEDGEREVFRLIRW